MRNLYLPLSLVAVLLAVWWALPDATRPKGLAPRTAAVPSEEAGSSPLLDAPARSGPGSERVGSSDEIPASVAGPGVGISSAPAALTFGDGARIPDPVQMGPCTLLLHIVDQTSGEPVAGTVTLWRLDAPASEHWKRGDQAQYSKGIPKEGGTFENLAAGTYRAVCHAERDDGSDPLAFRVSGALSEVTLELALPVDRAARALLYDEDGTPIREAQIRRGSRSWTTRVVGNREWVRERESLVPRTRQANYNLSGGAGGSFSSHAPRKWRSVSSAEQGFDLGSFPGDPRDRVQTHRVELRLPDGREVEVAVRGAHREERLYFSVFPRREPVLDSLVLPDGLTGHDISDEVSIEGRELLASEALTDEPWLEVPIAVYVHHPNYEIVSFTYKLGNGPLELRRLKLQKQ